MVPSWPLEAQAMVMTLDINNQMAETGKYLFSDNSSQAALDDNWEHTQLRVVRSQALVVCRTPGWQVVITSLPNCTQLTQICVMQSAPEAPSGRHINVYTYSGTWLYKINLDLYQYGLSRDESVCIYTNAAFLAAADSKRFVLFNVKNGNFLGVIMIPNHLERSKGKDEKDCMFEQTGLGLFIFDENKLIAVHDYERSFPAVLDIYKFW